MFLVLVFGSGTAILILLIYTLLTNPEKVQLWVSYIARFLSWFKESWDKKAVANEIEARNIDFYNSLNEEYEEDILPYKLKLKWVEEKEGRDAFIKKNRVVVKMYHHRNQAKNFVYTTLDYFSIGLIPNSQLYIDEKVMKSTEYTMAEKFFITERLHKCLKIFNEEIIELEKKNATDVYGYYQTLRKLDEKGFFTRIFLRELSELGELTPTGIHTDVKEETQEYTKHLKELAERRRGEERDINYKGKYIQSAIVFIAKPEVYLTYGTDPYLRYIEKCIREGYRTIYIFAMGSNVSIAEKVSENLEHSKDLLKVVHKSFSPSSQILHSSKGVYIVFEKIT